MKNKMKSNQSLSRRKFIGSVATATAALSFSPSVFGNVLSAFKKPDSKFGGVQIGAITYSWRSMPSTAEDILKYCVEAGNKAQRDWRLSVSMDKYKALRKMYNKAGVDIHIVKFSPANWSDEEIDYAFKAAKVMGAGGVTNEIGEEACQRLGKFAEKHNMYAIFHNHGQPGEPEFSFDKFLAYSPKNMLNFDAGHYFGATGKHPNELIERLHNRIFSIHTKDKTGKNGNPPNTNMPWGKGDTPIADMLKLVQKNKWPIYFDIELEYNVPENSDAQKEVIKCVEFCKEILV